MYFEKADSFKGQFSEDPSRLQKHSRTYFLLTRGRKAYNESVQLTRHSLLADAVWPYVPAALAELRKRQD